MESTAAPRQKGRKRLRNVELWTRKKRKIMKDRGKTYKTYKGESRSSKMMVASLSCSCQNHCALLVSASERKHIFESFYKLGDHDSQNKYLYGLIERFAPKRKRPRSTTMTTRSHSYHYHVRLNSGDQVRVCKKAFCEIHRISKRRVEIACKKLTSGVLFSGDERGKHKNRPHAINEELKAQVREHISSFPSQESHYSRHNNKRRKYLPANLSIARMHRLYLEQYEPNLDKGEKPLVKEWLYRKIFNEEFNFGFGFPRSDTCEQCDSLKISIDSAKTDEDREQLQTELANHHNKASQGYQSLRTDTTNSKDDADSIVLTFDLQQTLPVPTLTHGAMFYLRQLWVYNFGIHNCSSGSAVMCLWNECIAGRGSNEIISCLLEYFAHERPQAKKLICYSDSCFGQNKNTQMICFWSKLVNKGMFTRIDHKFLVRGHTYLPNDRDFAHIEKQKDSAVVHLPEDWEKHIQQACIARPFCIQKMSEEKFFDFTPITKEFTMRKKDSTRAPVLISTANWLNFGEGEDGGKIVSHPGEYWMRSSFNMQELWQKVCILKGHKKVAPPKELNVPILYPNGHPVNPKKIADLQKMIPFLPEQSRRFYTSLADHPLSTESDDD